MPEIMSSRERVLRTLEFNNPVQIPMDLWILPAAHIKYGKVLDNLLAQHKMDIASIAGPFDHAFTPAYYFPGKFTDPWGSVWTNIQVGCIGEVKEPVFADYEKMRGYTTPLKTFETEFDANRINLEDKITYERSKGKFIIGGWISVFERMQYLRGTEDLYCDIATKDDAMFEMIDIVMEFMRGYVRRWLTLDIDAIAFGDDWGTQISLLISPNSWRKIFKPLYSELIHIIKAAGKKVFFHSDGFIMDLYPEFIEMGVDALNSQLWCMDLEKIAEQYSGKITFWGEISRQTTLPNGTPEDVKAAADLMKRYFWKGGGLIGQSELNVDVPLENVKALLNAWNTEA